MFLDQYTRPSAIPLVNLLADDTVTSEKNQNHRKPGLLTWDVHQMIDARPSLLQHLSVLGSADGMPIAAAMFKSEDILFADYAFGRSITPSSFHGFTRFRRTSANP